MTEKSKNDYVKSGKKTACKSKTPWKIRTGRTIQFSCKIQSFRTLLI